MRLICPNCDAQYEVDDAVIPEGGRDVQCSNCAHTWFQASAAMLAGGETGPAHNSVELDEDYEDAEPEDVLPTLDVNPAEVSAQDTGLQSKFEPESSKPAATNEVRRRTLDDAVLSVLREEAERETKARIAEGGVIETQADLGLAQVGSAIAVEKAAPPSDRPRVSEPEEPVEALVSRATRRELLPDIEEINSTLRATSERGNEAAAMDAPETLRQKRNGFRRGFMTSLAVMVLLLLPYLLAEPLATRFPSTAPALMQYSKGIESLRRWMDEQMRSSTQSMRDSSNTSE